MPSAPAAPRSRSPYQNATSTRRSLLIVLAAVILAGVGFAVFHAARELSDLSRADYFTLLRSAGFTLLRVNAALLIGALWTVPVGVAIGFSPRLARIAQPLAQIAASIPATALFPVILLFLIKFRGGLELAAMLVMLLGTQWYILFNVIAGAMAIPTDLKEASSIFRFGSWDRWRYLILPGIFPYLVTGMVTASGNAWNASIIAEYFHFQGHIVSTTGLGSAISSASDAGRFDLLLAATLIMATYRGAHQSIALAAPLSSRLDPFQTRNVAPAVGVLLISVIPLRRRRRQDPILLSALCSGK